MTVETLDVKSLGEGVRQITAVEEAIVLNYATIARWPAYPGNYPQGSAQQVEQDAIIREDASWFNKHVAIIQGLIQSGNKSDLNKAAILTKLTRVELSRGLHKMVDGAGGYDLSKMQPYLELLDKSDKPDKPDKQPEIPGALGYTEETVLRLANVLSLSPDDANVPIDIGISTVAGDMMGRIDIKKDQISAIFSLANLSGQPVTSISDLTTMAQSNEREILKQRAKESAKKHLRVDPRYLEREASRCVEESTFLSDVVADVIAPVDPHRKAILAYHALATSGITSQADLEAINQDLAHYLKKALGQNKESSTLRTQQAVEGRVYPVILYSTQKANYRISITPNDGSYQLKIESVPSSDKHRNTQDRTNEGLTVINQVLGDYFSYVETEVSTPGLVILNPELEKMAHVDFEELSNDVLDYDLAHIGGLPKITSATIDNFVLGTIAYSAGETRTKPNSILLVGETGSGKTSVTKAVAREFSKVGIPVYRTSSIEQSTPSNLIKALITFQKDQNGGVLVIEDLEHGWLEGSPQEVDSARASLLRILNEINQSSSHVIILNTEHPNKILGRTEALGQTHRVDVVPCKLEISREGINDLTRAVVAKLLTTDLDNPVTKRDIAVDAELKRLFGETGVEKWESRLLTLAQKYADYAPLTGVTLNGAFKAANWEINGSNDISNDIYDHLERILIQKRSNRLSVAEAQTSEELAGFQKRLDAMEQQLEEHGDQVRLLFTAIDQLSKDTSGRLIGFEEQITQIQILATELVKSQLTSASVTPTQVATEGQPPPLTGITNKLGKRRVL